MINHRCGLKFEFLESRHLMAGNITAAQVGGDLIVEGDQLDNYLIIRQLTADSYRLSGSRDGTPDTMVNGQVTDVTVNGVSGNVVIRLAGGDDQLGISNSMQTIPKALIIEGGEGDDRIYVDSAIIGTELVVDAGAGNDFFDCARSSVGTGVVYRLGDGSDFGRFFYGTIAGDAVLDGGSGNDALGLMYARVGAYSALDGGSGSDELYASGSFLNNHAALRGQQGADSILLINSQFSTSALVDHGTEFGFTWSFGSILSSTFVLGSGPHSIDLTGSSIGRLELGLGGLNDTVYIRDSFVDAVFAALGDGSDQVVAERSFINRGSFVAGSGFDRFVNMGAGSTVQAQLVGFEEPIWLRPGIIRWVT
jgi:hypothetical protein